MVASPRHGILPAGHGRGPAPGECACPITADRRPERTSPRPEVGRRAPVWVGADRLIGAEALHARRTLCYRRGNRGKRRARLRDDLTRVVGDPPPPAGTLWARDGAHGHGALPATRRPTWPAPAAASAPFGWFRGFHLDAAAVQVLTIEPGYRLLRLLGRLHLDEAEAPRATRVTVGHDRGRNDGPGGREDLAKAVAGGVEGEATDEQLVRHDDAFPDDLPHGLSTSRRAEESPATWPADPRPSSGSPGSAGWPTVYLQ